MDARFVLNTEDVFQPSILQFYRIIDAKIDYDAVNQVMSRYDHHLLRVSALDIEGSDK